jgi:hypothetical protein
MMSTNSRTWKKAEGRIAALFDARRQVLSGSSGRDEATRSDTTHPRLFIEAKYRERHAVRSLFDATKALAQKEHKTPVVALIDKGRPGCLVCVHSDDLPSVVAEFTLANPELVERAIRETGAGRARASMPSLGEAAA